MYLFRNAAQNLHRENGPAIVTPTLTQYFVDGELHRSDGPAVITSYGKSYYWRGIKIPEWMWHHKWTGDELFRLTNIELRRCLIEKFGIHNILQNTKHEILHISKKGTSDERALIRIDVPDDEPITVVRVLDGTPLPSGEREVYYLRVPPTMTRADEAVAWTWDLPSVDYNEQLVEET